MTEINRFHNDPDRFKDSGHYEGPERWSPRFATVFWGATTALAWTVILNVTDAFGATPKNAPKEARSIHGFFKGTQGSLLPKNVSIVEPRRKAAAHPVHRAGNNHMHARHQ